MNNILRFINNTANTRSITIFTFLAILANSGCTLEPKDSTPAQAVLARATITEGQAKVASLNAELAGVINRYANIHPATTALIVEPPVEPAIPVLGTTLSQYYGVYEETSAGIYTKTSEFTFPIIQLKLQNGVDITFQGITYVGGEVSKFQLDIVSDQRSITTPLSEKVTIHLTYTFQKFIGPIENILNPPQDTRGNITFTRNIAGNLTPVAYQVQRTLSGTAQNGSLSIASGQSIRFDEVSSGDFWSVTQVVFFSKADPSNNASPYVGNAVNQVYRDKVVTSNISMFIQNLDELATTGLANYAGTGEVTLKTDVGRVRVATLAGGPYTCDINFPANSGTGTPMELIYADQTTISMMPSSEFNCAATVR